MGKFRVSVVIEAETLEDALNLFVDAVECGFDEEVVVDSDSFEADEVAG